MSAEHTGGGCGTRVGTARIRKLFCPVPRSFHVLSSVLFRSASVSAPIRLLAKVQACGQALTCVRISNTSLKPIVVSASFVCSIVTTFLLCSETCLPPTPGYRFDCVNACSWAICELSAAMSCLMM